MALGATQWQTIWKQVLPAAIPGIATGVILALSRAIGETAPLIVVGAAVFATSTPHGPVRRRSRRCRSRSSPGPRTRRQEFKALAAGGDHRPDGDPAGMNAVAIWLRNRYEQKW